MNKHPWWHWFFYIEKKTPQMIPPGECGNNILILHNIYWFCYRCNKGGLKYDALKEYRKNKQKIMGGEER